MTDTHKVVIRLFRTPFIATMSSTEKGRTSKKMQGQFVSAVCANFVLPGVSVLQYVAVRCRALLCVAVCCSVLQCVAVFCKP